MSLRRLLPPAIAVGLVACGFGLDGFTGGGGNNGADGGLAETGTGTSADGTTPPGTTPGSDGGPTDPPVSLDSGHVLGACPSGKGPAMVKLTDPNGNPFCIDGTEVTNDQYRVFLNSSPRTDGQGAACAFNDSYAPADDQSFNSIARGAYPITYVDWCDARAFCAWAGKRLCGRIGGGGLAKAADIADPRSSQMLWACTNGSTQLYPYGTSYRSAVCNSSGSGSVNPVTAYGACGSHGVVGLVGNVGEWSDACEPTTGDGSSDECSVNLASFQTATAVPSTSDRCDHYDAIVRARTNVDLGFRCCAD